MNPQKGPRPGLDRRSEIRVSRPLQGEPSRSSALTAQEEAVLDCLRRSGTGLTARQLESQVACEPGALEPVLGGLVERQLVARLNTIIPSYSFRSGGAFADAE